jgi:hypothetical protein
MFYTNSLKCNYTFGNKKSNSVRVLKIINFHYENNFGISSAKGAGNTKIVFLKAHIRCAFKKQFLEQEFLLKNTKLLSHLILC